MNKARASKLVETPPASKDVVEEAIDIVKRDRKSTWEKLGRQHNPPARSWGDESRSKDLRPRD